MSRMRTVFIWLFILTCLFIMLQGCAPEEVEDRIIERSTVSDIDGNVYITVKIGNQWWMAENLKTRHFSNGDPITFIDAIANDALWADLTTPGMTYALDTTRGFLYNFYAITDERKIAPEGWRVATEDDWQTLERYVGMPANEILHTAWRGSNEAELLASRASVGWGTGLLFGTDEFGFNARPAGVRIHDGRRNIEGMVGFWWTASSNNDSLAWYRYMDSNQTRVFRHYVSKKYGMALRCVKND